MKKTYRVIKKQIYILEAENKKEAVKIITDEIEKELGQAENDNSIFEVEEIK